MDLDDIPFSSYEDIWDDSYWEPEIWIDPWNWRIPDGAEFEDETKENT